MFTPAQLFEQQLINLKPPIISHRLYNSGIDNKTKPSVAYATPNDTNIVDTQNAKNDEPKSSETLMNFSEDEGNWKQSLQTKKQPRGSRRVLQNDISNVCDEPSRTSSADDKASHITDGVDSSFSHLALKSSYEQGENEDSDNTDITENVRMFWEAYSESDTESEENNDSDFENKDYIKINIDDTNEKYFHSYEKRRTRSRFKKLSFESVKNKFREDYELPLIYNYSAALDILASYVKCHINIYLEASYYCNFQLNLFMLPCIFLSAVCSVLGAFLEMYPYITLSVAATNGVIAFLLAIINYLKLDACSEAHKISSYQYTKLKNYIEFTSGEILLFQDPMISNKNYVNQQMKLWKINNKHRMANAFEYKNEKYKKLNELLNQRKELEKKLISSIQGKIIEFKKTLKNIHENNKFILPKHISKKYSNIYNINIFTYIKSIENYKLYVLNELRNIKNEMRFQNMYFSETTREISLKDKKERIRALYRRKSDLFREYFELHNGYALIDCMFRQEIRNIQLQQRYWYLFYMQCFINMIRNICTCYFKRCTFFDDNQIFIPENYKNPRQFGYMDKNGVYLLEKIMHYTKI